MGIMTSSRDVTARDNDGTELPAINTYPYSYSYSSLRDTCVYGVSMHTYMYLVVHVVHACVHGACMCIWCIYEKHLKSLKAHEKHLKSEKLMKSN